MDIIEIAGLKHCYPDGRTSLQRIDLTIARGSFVVLAGANGAGKSTLLKHCNGLLTPSEGTVSVGGVPVRQDPLHARRTVGMVFQDADSQIVGETVYDDAAFGPENLNWPAARIKASVERALHLVGLSEMYHRSPHLLSGGEKRRLAIAGVLAMEPEVIVLDEPFANLDYDGVRQILAHIVALHGGGTTIVVCVHDLEKVLAHAGRLIIMREGRIVADGPPDSVVLEAESHGVRIPAAVRLGMRGGIMAAVVFGFRSERTFLHALDARVKLAALVLISMAGLHAGLPALGLAFLAAMWLLALARCSPLRCLLGMKWYLVLLGCVLAARTLTTPGDLIFDQPWLPASRQGVHAGLLAAGRLLVIALFGLLVTFTTRPSEIRAAVEWLLQPIPFIPHRQAATMIGLLVRFIPVILTQSAEQQEALRARSIENCKNPLRRITALCMPLLRRTCITADRLASAMEARCYGAERTIPCRPVTPSEWSALMLVAGFCGLMLAISV